MKHCPDCGSKKLENNTEGIVCKSCGSVLEENYFSGGKVV